MAAKAAALPRSVPENSCVSVLKLWKQKSRRSKAESNNLVGQLVGMQMGVNVWSWRPSSLRGANAIHILDVHCRRHDGSSCPTLRLDVLVLTSGSRASAVAAARPQSEQPSALIRPAGCRKQTCNPTTASRRHICLICSTLWCANQLALQSTPDSNSSEQG